MTVAELIAQLSKHKPDALVIMASDEEGNIYSPLSRLTVGGYIEDTTWEGDYKEGEDLERRKDDAVACVALWPVN